jgi:RNA polymerase sigma-70 factor (ECF subfamily)
MEGVAVAPWLKGAAVDYDTQLIDRYRKGEKDAFEQLFRRYERSVFNFVSKMVPAEEALDVTMETFYSAMRALDTFKRGRRFSSWLFTIAKNKAFDTLRKRRRRAETSYDEDIQRVEEVGEQINPEREIGSRETQHCVQRILQQLTPKDRMALVLRDFEGLSHAEIAEITGGTVASVKSQIHRARMHFKELYERHVGS